MKILIINNTENNKAYFVNPKSNTIPNLPQDIEKITKEDIFDIIDYMINNDIDMDEYKEKLIPNPAQDIIYKNLYENFQSLNDKKASIISEVDDKFKAAEEKYLEG